MTAPASHPVRTAVRYLISTHRVTLAWFWAVLLAAWVVGVVVTSTATDIRTSVWQFVGQAPPKWFLMVLGIVAASVTLPQFVAHGLTRRHASLAWSSFFAAAAVLFGVLALAGFGLEHVVYSATGLADSLTGEYRITSPGDAAGLAVRVCLLCLAWAYSGWLVGVGFYRFGAWGGIAFIPLGSLPAAAAEFEFSAGGLSRASGMAGLAVDAAVGVGAVAVGFLAALLIVRTVAIRNVSG